MSSAVTSISQRTQQFSAIINFLRKIKKIQKKKKKRATRFHRIKIRASREFVSCPSIFHFPSIRFFDCDPQCLRFFPLSLFWASIRFDFSNVRSIICPPRRLLDLNFSGCLASFVPSPLFLAESRLISYRLSPRPSLLFISHLCRRGVCNSMARVPSMSQINYC